jgi:hypothetical protein
MNDVTRPLMVLLFIIVCFGISFWSYDHIDNSYMLNEPEYVIELEATVDSLETVIVNQKEADGLLREEIKDLESAAGEESEEAGESEEVADE